MRPLRKIVTAAIVLLILGACSSVKLLYTFADDLVESQAADHLLLDDQGEILLRRQIDALFDWHRARALPGYAKFFRNQAAIVERNAIDRAAVTRAVSEIRRHLEELTFGAAPFIAQVLIEHTSPERVEHLRKIMAEKLRDREDDLNDPPDQRLERRVERIVDNFERFTGDLEEAQRKIIRRYASSSIGDVKIRLLNRARRQRAFIEFMSRQPSEADIVGFVQKILLRSEEIVDPAYKTFAEARWLRFETLLFDVFTSLTPVQRKNFANSLKDYAYDLKDLSS